MNNLEVQEYNLEKIDLYDGLVDTFKDCFRNEVINLIKECKEEIISLRTGIDLIKNETKNIYKDCIIMAKQLHVNNLLMQVKSKKARKQIKKLLLSRDGDVSFIDRKHIDSFFNVVIGEIENDG